jgi:parallel beta-helix repeat protein
LIEEGCSADIIANHLNKNLRANIALGGAKSEYTRIKFNLIERSKQEGIFVVEGGTGDKI